MNVHADKTQENKSHSGANAASQRHGGESAASQFFDNGHEGELKEMANNSTQAKQSKTIQKMADNYSEQQQPTRQKENKTGLPDKLKSGIENLSGYSMDDVKVHYNSDEPAQLQALAYTQGTDIHVASGQERHLPHEAWHVVQQMQGRVKPTMQMKGGVNVNDDADLEKEADLMGRKAFEVEVDNYPKNKNVSPIEQNEVKQLLRIKGKSVTSKFKGVDFTKIPIPYLISLIKIALPDLEKSLVGKLAVLLDKDNETDFDTEEEAIAYIKEKGDEYQTALSHQDIVKSSGDKTEEAAAAIIGGRVNRDKDGRDVEWRLIERQLAERIKAHFNIPPGPNSDQTLFEQWDAIRQKLKNNFEGVDLNEIISTPTDAFSSDTIALAGGPFKFEKASNNLKEKDAQRVRELKKLAALLGYKPILVFSATVSCQQCDAVASEFDIDVIHLEE